MPSKRESILLAAVATGVVISLLELIPALAGCLMCAAYIGSGVLAVWHYTNTYDLTVSMKTGIGMGMAAAVGGATLSALINYLLALVGVKPTMREQVAASIEALENSGLNPEQLDQMRAWASSPAFIISVLVMGLVLVSLLGLIGGVIGASVYKRGEEA